MQGIKYNCKKSKVINISVIQTKKAAQQFQIINISHQKYFKYAKH